ncbi:hypothetical protein ACTFIV_006925 [Dictyostelium citrinum]
MTRITVSIRVIAIVLLMVTPGWAKALLTIGTTSGYAPFVSLTPEGVYEGFDIDMAHLIAKKLGRTVVIQDYGSMAGLMLALKQKKVDALFMGHFHHTLSAAGNGDGALSRRKVQEPFREAALTRINPFPLKLVTHITDGILELRYKKCQGVAVDHSLIPRVCRQYPQFKVMHLELPEEEQSQGHGICFKEKKIPL